MPIHRLGPVNPRNTIGSHAPVLAVAPGDVVIVETLDAHGFDREGKKRGADPNPMTGPILVNGAEPGDTLAITIRRITLNRGSGWTRAGLSHGVVEPSAAAMLPRRDKTDWLIDIAAGRVTLEVPPPALRDWSLPVEPMIGCFGVAPTAGQAISTATSGPYGGNMDYRGFRPGTTAMLPVAVTGALFFLGDVHARQGDGEIAGTGIETTAEVEVEFKLIKGKTIGWPRGETETEIFTIGNARPLDQALQHATTEMLHWLAADYGLDPAAACHLMGMAVRYHVANVFNPAYSVACRIEKRWLPGGN
jgi:acetamidase/formamidase